MNSFNIGGGRVRMDAITETAEERCRAFNDSTATQFKLRSQLIRHPRIAFYGDPDRIADCVKNCLNTVRSSKLLMFIAVRRLFRSVTLLMRWVHRYIAAKRAKVMALVEHWESEEFIRRRSLDAEMSSPNYRVRKGIPEAMQASQEVNVPRNIKMEVASMIVKRHSKAHWRLRVGWSTRLFAIEKELVECKTIASAQLYGASLTTAMSARIDWGKIRRLRLQYMQVAVECPKRMDCTKQSWGALHAVRQEILEKRVRKGRDVTMQTYAEKKEDERRRRIEIFNAAEKKRIEDYRIAQNRAQRGSGGGDAHEDGEDEDAHPNTSGDSPQASPLSVKRRSSSASPDGARFKIRRRSSVTGAGIYGATMSGLTLTKVDEQDLIDGERSWNSPQGFDPSSPCVKGDTLSSTLSASIMDLWAGNRSIRRHSPSTNQESASAPFSTHVHEEDDDQNRPPTATPPLLPTTIPDAPSCVSFDTVESHVSQQSRANIRISLRRDLSKVNGGNIGPKRDLDDSLVALNPLTQRLAAVARTKSLQGLSDVCDNVGALTKEYQTPPRRASMPAPSASNGRTTSNSSSRCNVSPSQLPLVTTPEATILKYFDERQVADRVLQSRRATTISLSLDRRVSLNSNSPSHTLLPQINRTPDGLQLSTNRGSQRQELTTTNRGGSVSPQRASCLPGDTAFSPSKRSHSVGGMSSSSVGVSILGRDKRAPVESMIRGSFSRQGPSVGSPPLR